MSFIFRNTRFVVRCTVSDYPFLYSANLANSAGYARLNHRLRQGGRSGMNADFTNLLGRFRIRTMTASYEFWNDC